MTTMRFGLAAALGLAAIGTAEAQEKSGSARCSAHPGARRARHASRERLRLRSKDLGGPDAEVFVVDDELKPDVAVTKVKALIDRSRLSRTATSMEKERVM